MKIFQHAYIKFKKLPYNVYNKYGIAQQVLIPVDILEMLTHLTKSERLKSHILVKHLLLDILRFILDLLQGY